MCSIESEESIVIACVAPAFLPLLWTLWAEIHTDWWENWYCFIVAVSCWSFCTNGTVINEKLAMDHSQLGFVLTMFVEMDHSLRIEKERQIEENKQNGFWRTFSISFIHTVEFWCEDICVSPELKKKPKKIRIFHFPLCSFHCYSKRHRNEPEMECNSKQKEETSIIMFAFILFALFAFNFVIYTHLKNDMVWFFFLSRQHMNFARWYKNVLQHKRKIRLFKVFSAIYISIANFQAFLKLRNVKYSRCICFYANSIRG